MKQLEPYTEDEKVLNQVLNLRFGRVNKPEFAQDLIDNVNSEIIIR